MRWYGLQKPIFSKKKKINLQISTNFKTKSLNLILNAAFNFRPLVTHVYIPSMWNFVILRLKTKKNFAMLTYFYSETYFFFLPINLKLTNFYFDLQSKVMLFNALYNNNFYNLYWSFFKLLFYSFSLIFFKKIKFRGKGYYIYKNFRNTIAMQFGYSHRIRMFFYYVNIKFLSKTAVLVFGVNYYSLINSALIFKNVKSINIFTGKGIRFSKQLIYKKTGKISSYR
jgi:hypothetical protein